MFMWSFGRLLSNCAGGALFGEVDRRLCGWRQAMATCAPQPFRSGSVEEFEGGTVRA